MFGFLKVLRNWKVLTAVAAAGAILLGHWYVQSLKGTIEQQRARTAALEVKIEKDRAANRELRKALGEIMAESNKRREQAREGLNDPEGRDWGSTAVPDSIRRMF